MELQSIIEVMREQSVTIDCIKQQSKKLSRLNNLLYSIKSAYPLIYDEASRLLEQNCKQQNSPSTLDDYSTGWDSRLSMRKRVLELLTEAKRFIKVGDLAKMAFTKESVYTKETEASLQVKISRTLTALKKIKKLGVEKRKIHSGSNGYAWGLSSWDEDGYLETELNRQIVYENDPFKLFD